MCRYNNTSALSFTPTSDGVPRVGDTPEKTPEIAP